MEILSNFLAVWCVLLHVKHYKLTAGRDSGRMTNKKGAGTQKLVATRHKTAEELAYEEYQKQLELAIENH